MSGSNYRITNRSTSNIKMNKYRRKIKRLNMDQFTSIQKSFANNFRSVVLVVSINIFIKLVYAQSIGYHSNLNLGFNPYLSPVFGYGLGLPYGSYSFGPLRDPTLAYSVLGGPYGIGTGESIMGKLHAKSMLKKIGWNPFGAYPYSAGGIKSKVHHLKNPEYAFTPYGAEYGYGKHYGSAMVPNYPYKSTYGDYYNNANNNNELDGKSNLVTLTSDSQPSYHVQDGMSHQPPLMNPEMPAIMKAHSILKPLIKVGAIVTTAALLHKKSLEGPTRLNPSGMILNGGLK